MDKYSLTEPSQSVNHHQTAIHLLREVAEYAPIDLKAEIETYLSTEEEIHLLMLSLNLTPIENTILSILLSKTIGEYGELIEAANIKTPESLWVHKRRLEKKLIDQGIGVIERVSGVGYRLVRQ